MTNGDVLELYYGLHTADGREQKPKVNGLRVNFALSKNMDVLKSAVKHIRPDIMVPETEEYTKYRKELRSLYEKYSKGKTKNVDGRMVMDISENEEEFKKDKKVLDETHKEVTEEREKQIQEYNKFLGEEFTEPLDIKKVGIDDIEEYNKDMDAQTFEIIKFMIKDTEL